VGKPGLYLQGSVTPPLSGVRIQIISSGKSSYAQLQEGDLAAETETNSDGHFSAGPLYDDINYKIEASKVSDVWYVYSRVQLIVWLLSARSKTSTPWPKLVCCFFNLFKLC
jgi:hypothetical protein